MNLMKTGSASRALAVLACFEQIFGDGDAPGGDVIMVGFTSIESLCAIEISNQIQRYRAWVSGHRVGDSYTVWLARAGEYDFDKRAAPNYEYSHQYLFPWNCPHEAAEAILNFLKHGQLPQQKEEETT